MRALLDTHSFLWWICDDPKLSDKARRCIADGNNALFFSAASGWEIAIKTKLGKLHLPSNISSFLFEQMHMNAVSPLPIRMEHALHVQSLPDYHRDPFDRMIIAQAQVENMTIITSDNLIGRYQVQALW